MKNIKTTWPTKKLGEVISVIESGKRPKGGAVSSGTPSLGVEHISDSNSFKLDDLKYIPEDFYESLSKGKLDRGDILIAKDGATTGKTVFLSDDFPFPKAAVNEHIFILRGNKGMVNQKFLFFILYSPYGQKQILKTKHGAAQGGIDQSFVNFVQIPLPPLKIQKQIVERLDKIAEAQKLNDKLIQKSEELFQSLLHSLIRANSGIRNWPIKKLGDIVDIQSGSGFPMTIQGKTDGGLPFYKVSDMNLIGNEIEMIFHNNTITKSQSEILKYKPAPIGTIIFPKIGAAVATNKKRILSRSALYDNNVMGLIPSSGVLSKYLYFWLLTFNISLWASESMPPSIKKSTVEKFEIPLPSLKTQKQIVEKLSAVQEYKNKLVEQKEKLQELFESCLDKAMKGELVK